MQKRSNFLSSLLVAGGIAAYLYFDNFTLGTTHYEIESTELPKQLSGLKIAHISDLHIPRNYVVLTDIVKAVRDSQADAIFITGDLVDGSATFDTDELTIFIQDLMAVAPVFYSNGNHERLPKIKSYVNRFLAKIGAYVLDNQSVVATYNDFPFVVMGLGEGSIIDMRQDRLLRKIKLPAGYESNYRVLLAHHPELFLRYHDIPELSPDVTFSGHAHGGQVRIPFLGGLFSPGQGFLPKRTEGVYHLPGNSEKKLVISRGIGASTFPLRVNNRPELVIVTLLHKGADTNDDI